MFFFFFKQKTAYEMRISAWSSDVCSSDLADSRDERERGSVSAGPAIANPSPRNRSNNAAEPSRRAQGDAQKSDRLLREQRCERSEEHTSELQSLMRISYAVFCLKKKKTIQKYPDQNSPTKDKIQVHNIP